MNDLRSPSGPSPVLRSVRTLLFAGALALLGWTAFRAAVSLGGPASATHFPVTMLLAFLLYAGSHLVRIARLALIAGEARLSLRDLARVHLFTSGVSLALPFKLGDVYRAAELSALSSGTRGIVTVFAERFLDACAILLLLLVAAGSQTWNADAYGSLLAASLLFVAATFVAAALLPDNLRRLGDYVMRRHRGEWTVSALRRIAEERAVIAQVRAMLHGRHASLFAFTVLIWLLEAASLASVFAAAPGGFRPLGTLLAFLSSTAEGLTLPVRVSPEALTATPAALAAYLAATQVPLALAGLAAGASMMGRRLAVPARPRLRPRRIRGHA